MNSYLQRIPTISPRDLLVVAYTSHFFGDDYVEDFCLPDSWGLPVKCRFSSDLNLIDQADALWFHGPSIKTLPRKKTGQKWILMSMESDKNYPLLANSEFLDRFDIKMTYRLDSDVPCIYPDWETYGDFLRPPIPLAIKNRAAASTVYIASNPVAHRDQYVEELMKYMPIDSLGSCLKNKKLDGFENDSGAWVRDGFNSVTPVIKCYKFYIAIENSITTDYVTERVLLALANGSIPIYYGAQNIEEFLPGDRCIIDVRKYDQPADLAAHLAALNDNNAQYNEYLDWKLSDLPESFTSLVDIGSIEPKHRMAIKLLHDCNPCCGCGGRIRFYPE